VLWKLRFSQLAFVCWGWAVREIWRLSYSMEILLATIGLGIIAKILEFKLEKNIKQNDYVPVEKVSDQRYSLDNVETF